MASPRTSANRSKPPAKPASSGPGRPKDLGKRAAILEAAKQLFAREGFNGVSMDQIAAEAGVSKLTVYSHFGDKDALFAAAVKAKCEEMLPDTLFELELTGSLRDQLKAIAQAFFALVTSEEAISTHRMMMVPGNIDDKLKQTFWQAGPQRTHDAFAAMLQALVTKGELDIPDVATASVQFFTLIKGEVHARMTCGLCSRPGPMDARQHVEATVDMFLRAYGRR
ncbi:TetR/AcrR family transcriptional regulator [Pseudoxanthomonas sp. LH2527]|uniref:TetR/AcrR family transcriptional regulator n=1 Tax=Pseudoxanthomonas sp. LH2527 TaxID=2923249 RepID=UPI001F13E192|nr:TetR/AcrR family transcriptional regulator [Pseudoxanthomonas sp. LH2527]MCH6483344.1 TetR/AcrR family transcriptional regulator [Pseudoxanthomonas sp. LH2527]